MEIAILVLHVLAALGICGLVLLQHGKGADVGAAFGSGSAGSVFGSAGSANFLSRATAILALVFFLTSLGLTYFSSRKSDSRGVMADHPVSTQSVPGQIPGQTPGQGAPVPAAPAAPAAAPADGGRAQEVPK
jgi:preprotein translocase subunit SecG